ncbi:transcription factor ETV6-like isoform X2 [Acanthaster planci]|uniref:Transcription factor ETV6-like isoform X2 n=1 Tax=Acanthaster planci TaxID=133434 RepID=A0A8B7XSJ4_ACAPL|nr:transcription factor ETV6-like isoform X2 [Acanthaster planci]
MRVCSPADFCDSQPLVEPADDVKKVIDLTVPRPDIMQVEADTLRVASRDPRLWTRADVVSWLEWARGFYQLDSVDTTKFAMNGRGLCLLTRSGFMNRAPSCGDVLHSDFQRRYAVAVLRAEEVKKTKRRALWRPDATHGKDDSKKPKVEENQ